MPFIRLLAYSIVDMERDTRSDMENSMKKGDLATALNSE